MIDNYFEYFEEVEIEHDFTTYYANGYVEYTPIMGIGGSYEGYDFEVVYEREIVDVTLTDLWYFDDETGNAVEVIHLQKYADVEELAKEEIEYRFE